MSKLHHPFAVDGQGVFMGHPIFWRLAPNRMEVEFLWKSYQFAISNLELLQKGFGAVVEMAQLLEEQNKMASPGIISSNQLGGSGNGVSRQAAQAVSGHPNQALAGSGGGGRGTVSQYTSLSSAKLAAAAARYSNKAQLPTNVWHEHEVVYPLKTEGFRCGEILAWRGWRVTPQGFLRSMSADVIWGPGEPMDGKTKSSEEHCGVYAYKKLRDFLSAHSDDLDVYGQVALWGDVIEHELGYRAEYAKVISLESVLGKNRTHGFSLSQLREIYKLQ